MVIDLYQLKSLLMDWINTELVLHENRLNKLHQSLIEIKMDLSRLMNLFDFWEERLMLLDKILFYKLIRNLMLIEMERSNLMTLQNFMMQPNIQMFSLEIKV